MSNHTKPPGDIFDDAIRSPGDEMSTPEQHLLVWHGDRRCRGYALTFDDGPTPEATERVLDLLGGLGAVATFFVIGKNAQQWPTLLRRCFDEGHLIANHTWSHSRVGFLRGPWYWRRELRATDDVIESIIGRRPAFYRPPMGWRTPINSAAAAGENLVTAMWSRKARDGVATTAKAILQRLTPAVAGDILLLHDGVEPGRTRDPGAMLSALPELVARLAESGLSPRPLHKLTGRAGYRDPPTKR